MTRMSKEFSLVLLGAGMLTAGSFVWPEDDFEGRANEAAAEQVGGHAGGSGRTHYRPGFIFIPLGMGGRVSSASPARSSTAAISRGGFGGVGRSISVGG